MEDKDLLGQLDAISAILRYWIFEVSDEDLQNYCNGNITEDEAPIKGISSRLLEIASFSNMLRQRLRFPIETEVTIAFNKPGEIIWGDLEPREQ